MYFFEPSLRPQEFYTTGYNILISYFYIIATIRYFSFDSKSYKKGNKNIFKNYM